MKPLFCLGGTVLGWSLALCLISTAAAAEPADDGLKDRYGVEVDLKRYPQDDPQQAIRSVIQAARQGDIEYLLAHLVSPAQVDRKLGGDRGSFRQLVAKATPEKSRKLAEALGKQLRDGVWTIQRNQAWAKAEGVPELSLEKLGARWFMHNTPVARPR